MIVKKKKTTTTKNHGEVISVWGVYFLYDAACLFSAYLRVFQKVAFM